MNARGLIIAAPHSGAGKTTITLAIMAALARRGISVRGAKAGPDYIDPAFHAAATGAPSVNLDCWAMGRPLLNSLAATAAANAEILAIEGVMGLFDGVGGAPGHDGTTAALAAHFGLPVVMVLDISGQAQSAAAVLRGFAAHDPAVQIGGVILNRVGSARHRALVTDAIAVLGIPVLGAVPRDENLALPARHLGLVQASEHPDLQTRLDHLAAVAERYIDLDAVKATALPLALSPINDTRFLPPPGQRIALARDAAFSFVYPHLLDAWRRGGVEIVTFSPLADEPPQADCDSCWLPGGYPELHAAALASAHRFRDGLCQFAATRPVHGECGGYMVLGESLEDAEGRRHAMTGLLGHSTSFARRKLHLGYREARLCADGALGPAGAVIRGHEFHYASLDPRANADEPFAELFDGNGNALGKAGGRRGFVTGTFFHAIANADCLDQR